MKRIVFLLLFFLVPHSTEGSQLLFVDELYDVIRTNPAPAIGTSGSSDIFPWQARRSFAAPSSVVPFPAGTIQNLGFVVTSGSATCTTTGALRINGATSGTITCGVTGVARSSCFDSDSVSISSGDTVALIVSTSGAGCTSTSGKQPQAVIEFIAN